MKTLKMNNLMRNLTLLAAGAIMATLVVLPITTSASHDELDRPARASAPTFTLGANNGISSVFELVEINGNMVLSVVDVHDFRIIDED